MRGVLDRFRLAQVLSLVLVVLCALTLQACGLDKILGPDGGTTQTQTVNVTVGVLAPSPSPSASPSASPATGVITLVKVTEVGESCPAGVSPATGQREVRVGCSAFITCTPFVGDRLATVAEHGPAPTSYGITSGSGATFSPWPAEPYNADLKGVSPGPLIVSCAVKGITGAADFTVVK